MTHHLALQMPGIARFSDQAADVLVIGGGPAGTWAALSAAQRGARAILVDKGFCGTSGATASAGTGVWYVQPSSEARLAAMKSREEMGGHLADRRWMGRVLDRTYDGINQVADWGYPFPVDDEGNSRRTSLQGPEYMRLMRRQVRAAGVRILDHSPALELLVDESGAVVGAAGLRRQKGEPWTVRAKAVVIATGGCAFLSNALGCNVLTGDGYLMAAEAGAEMSGMEFSNAYAIAPAHGELTKTLFYNWATFTHEDGSVIPGAGSHGGRSVIARVLHSGRQVYAQIDKADEETRAAMRQAQPNFFLAFDRARIDPFTQRFAVTLRLEGTVRGTGGLRIVDDSCATTVPGLYAAGDAATRELICGGFTGGGSHNAAWAMSSGYWAGAGAADHARRAIGAERRGLRTGGAALAERYSRPFDPNAVLLAVQNEVLPYHRNYFRNAGVLTDSLGRLDRQWRALRAAGPADNETVVKAREAAAMVATARWMYRSALARQESRGMHKREDYPKQDPAQRYYLTSGGLDEVWIAPKSAPALPAEEVAA